jgi:hypothetical protein
MVSSHAVGLLAANALSIEQVTLNAGIRAAAASPELDGKMGSVRMEEISTQALARTSCAQLICA